MLSFFKRLNRCSPAHIEKGLEKLYSEMLSRLPTGMTFEQAHKEVKKAIQLCKRQATEEGTVNLPVNYGDLIIQAAEQGESGPQRIINKARKEGATDEDIKEFWNLIDLERRMVIWSENVFRYSVFLSARESGMSADDAMLQVRKMYPTYGDPDDTSNTSGDDTPLPHELRGRVDAYREKLGASIIKERVKQYTTYNAFIRDEIRKGSL